jgi:GNAT-like C-terminal domain/N-acyltransferase N-terminal domain
VRSLVQLRFHDDADRDDPVVQSFLARIPEARALHRARGLTDEESWATLQDLPRHAHLDRLLHGSPGLRKDWWVERAFDGRLFQLGRLQFEPRRTCLAIHIPEDGTSLTPAAVDASLARAREVFPEYDEACCTSWLLDPQLREYLPPDSNILRFQRRFTASGESGVEERILEFVFHALPDTDLAALPQESTLQRAVVAHLRSGGRWHYVAGRLDL